jgi:hypothetical protein
MADTSGTITSFSSTPRTAFNIGGDSYEVQTAGQGYSLTNPDPQTLRFEVQPGDRAWYDGSYPDRSEIEDYSRIAAGTPIAIDYQVQLEPNGPNNTFTNTTSSYFILGQMHNDDSVGGASTSPPFYVNMVGDQMQFDALYVEPGGNPTNGSPDLQHLTWTGPTIVPGQNYDINVQANFSNTGAGYLKVSVDGQVVVNYQGPLGFGNPTYWEYGIYRSPASETAAAEYRNMTLVTGSAASGWQGAGGTTTSSSTTGTSSTGTTASGSATVTDPTGSTSSGTTSSDSTSGSGTTTPTMPVAPTLTVANGALSVSPGGSVSLGIGVTMPHAGDNVTVNISGLPKYETITDNLDGNTFSGKSITLTAAEVNSGLSLSSSYRGKGHPTATLTVTATDSTGTPMMSAAQTITVKDPPATTTSSTSTTTSGDGKSSGQWHHDWSHHHHTVAATGTETATTTSDNSMSSGRSPAHHIDVAQWFTNHPDFARAATTLSEAGAARWGVVSATATTTDATGGAGAKAYALLNQMMAGDFDSNSHFAHAATASESSQQHANFLTRPLH